MPVSESRTVRAPAPARGTVADDPPPPFDDSPRHEVASAQMTASTASRIITSIRCHGRAASHRARTGVKCSRCYAASRHPFARANAFNAATASRSCSWRTPRSRPATARRRRASPAVIPLRTRDPSRGGAFVLRRLISVEQQQAECLLQRERSLHAASGVLGQPDVPLRECALEPHDRAGLAGHWTLDHPRRARWSQTSL